MHIHNVEKGKPLKKIKKEALRMLEKDFCIAVSEEDKQHLQSLTSEIQVEQFTHRVISNYKYH